MKRELAFVLEVQSQFSRSLGRTRATKVRTSPCNGCSESVSHKRFKRFEANESSSDWRDGVVESVIEEELKCDLVKSVCEEEVKNELAQPQIKEEPKDGMEEGTIKEGGPIVIGESSEKPRRRFTRSALKPKVEPMDVSVPVTGSSEAGNGEAVSKVDEKATTAVSVSRTPKKNLELKMSKKIALNKIPLTVKELLETGMLEGYPVVYGGGTKTSGLRGTIKDLGILCSCFSCKGCRVVAPSQFERHACKSYRRAAQYIYLENGNNFLKVLKACKDAPLDTLEATIQSAIGPFPVKKSIMCQNCKGSLPPSCATKIGPLCNSCMESKKSQASPTHTTIRRARSSTPVLIKKSSKTASACTSSQNKSRGKITKKHQQLHRLVFEEGGLPDGTEVAYYARGQKLLEGYKKGFGIFCRCCQSEVSPSLFEAHAGWASRKKPYSNIYTSNGVSLHELSISLSKGRKYSAKDSDDLCIICADGGNLLLCDGCPRVFHKECASLSSIPRGDWYCQYCQNVFRRERFVEHNANAVAAGRVSGVDAIEQITKRCIRIVKNLEAEVSGCVLCRGGGFSKSGFGPRTVILCDQCEKEFHVGCLKDHKMADLKQELPKGKWFCCMDCRRIHSTLQKLLVRGAEKLPDSLLNVIKKKHEEKAHEEKGSNTFTNFDVRWRLLSGKIASPETRSLLSKAVAIFHDCFDPIIDSTTGRDLIPSMVYGRNTRGQEFGGMYCAVLTVNESVVSAGILRVFGREGAELPLVATSNDNHGKGYFQTLFSCIEKLLAFLNVRSIFLPAAEEAESIWSEKFGFKKIKPDQLSNFRKNCCQMMTFQGTSMLQKMVPECRIIHKNIE